MSLSERIDSYLIFPISVLDGPMSNVVQLRSTPPLFKAYEEVYGILESKYCPSFFKSEEVGINLAKIF